MTAGMALASGLLLTGCGLGEFVKPANEAKLSYDVADKVSTLVVRSDSGDIVVDGSDRSDVHVTETSHWRGDDGDRPRATHPVNGGRLTLGYDCPGWTCGVDYRVEVPRGLDVKVETGSGEITLRELSGSLDVTTGSGDIDANELSGKSLIGQTGSGDVTVKYTSAPDDIRLETGSGGGTVVVPPGTYNVRTETGSGEEKVGVTRDTGAPRQIVVKTGSGDVKVLATDS